MKRRLGPIGINISRCIAKFRVMSRNFRRHRIHGGLLLFYFQMPCGVCRALGEPALAQQAPEIPLEETFVRRLGQCG
jgi:hypothetical protein